MTKAKESNNNVKDEIVSNANSEGLLIDFYGFNATRPEVPDGLYSRSASFDTNKALTVIKNDPTVKAAITTLVDKILESGWRIEAVDKKSRKKELEKKLEETRFNLVLRKLLYNLFLYNNAFIEIVKKGNQLSDLNILETTLMRIKAKDNGDVVKYIQEVGKRDFDPAWTPEYITHVKLGELTNQVWAEPLDIQSIYETCLIKDYVRQYLMWFFGTNQMRGLYIIKAASTQKVKDFLSYLKASEKDKTKPVIIEGEATYQLLNDFSKQGSSLLDLLKWCDEQILMLFQVPPIAVGLPDSSGRSNSVEQYAGLNTRILSVQRLLEDTFTYDLFDKMGFEKGKFKFGVLDESTRRKVFEVVQILKQSMFTEEAIREYLQSQDVYFETSKLMEDPIELAQASNKSLGTGNEGMKGNKSADSAPSRQRQNNQTLSKANQSAMVKNSEEGEIEIVPDKFGQYPYVIDVVKEDV